tara:strand:+ start:23527 stop:24123 length:597 start_codon:yes stop_codon:yes gene_type:complete
MKTPDDHKRETIREIFKKRLKESTVILSPVGIEVNESLDSDFTSASISFDEKVGAEIKRCNLTESNAKGLVDAIFKILFANFSSKYSSIANIQLKNYQVKPIFNSANFSTYTDAKTTVTITSEIKNHGLVDFSSTSRSIIYSTLCASLKTFQFYINCERTFDILSRVLVDAKGRGRPDIEEACIRDMTFLTSMNTYEQ